MKYVAKSARGNYWCGSTIGWVACRYCALAMSRVDAHAKAHSVSGKCVIIRKPASHAIELRGEAERKIGGE
jgi:hypothetical protein